MLLVAILLLTFGEELWSRFVPKYLEFLGAGAWGVAAYGTLKELLDAIYQYPGGWVTDRLGRRAALIFFTLLAAAGYILYLVAPRWEWILLGTFLAAGATSLTLPTVFAVIGDSLPQTRRAMGFGVQSIWKRVPIIVAPPIGGALIAAVGLAAGMRVGLAATVLLALVAVVVVRRHYRESAPPPDAEALRFRDVWRTMDRRLRRLLVSDCLARLAEGIPSVFVVLYVVNVLRADLLAFGWLTSVQMATAILLYVPVARLADRTNRKPFVLLTFTFFALFPLALISAGGGLWLIGAFAVAGLREIGEPARKALIVDLSAPAARGRAVGMYYLIRGFVVFPASILGAYLYVIDPKAPFFAAFLVGAAGAALYGFWGPADRPLAPAAAG
ncbi:MAG: MFS transporter [bacterium]